MKVVIQRVSHASCVVDNQEVGKIKQGYLLLVGFQNKDTFDVLPKMVKKIVNLRIFEDDNQKMNLSIQDVQGEILSISQFTLYANLQKGNRPSFTDSLAPENAIILYNQFNGLLKQSGLTVEQGVFGAHMDIQFTNSGPVTIIIEL
jgi:D-tyrosyl-tRNA(Tyr) deacylase